MMNKIVPNFETKYMEYVGLLAVAHGLISRARMARGFGMSLSDFKCQYDSTINELDPYMQDKEENNG